MAISLKHAFNSGKSDGVDATLVQPSNWNAEHTLQLATSKLVGRTTAGTGSAEEIAVSSDLLLSSGTLGINTSVVTLTGGQTLTNKTLTSPTIGSAGFILNGLSSGTTTIKANSTAGGWTFSFPSSAGTSGYVLSTDGSGNTSWAAQSGGATGGSNDKIFHENDQTVTTNYTITTNKNAGTFGPVTVNSGVTVTVPSGSTWSIV